MGVTLHYRGTLADKAGLAEFKEELIDIAESMEWEHRALDEDWMLPNTATLGHTARGVSIVGHMGDTTISQCIQLLQTTSEQVEERFPHARAFLRPGCDQEV